MTLNQYSVRILRTSTCLHKILHSEYGHETLQIIHGQVASDNTINKYHQTAHMVVCNQGNIDAICARLNAGDDIDANLHHSDDMCSSKVILQTIIQWLFPMRYYIEFPELGIRIFVS